MFGFSLTSLSPDFTQAGTSPPNESLWGIIAVDFCYKWDALLLATLYGQTKCKKNNRTDREISATKRLFLFSQLQMHVTMTHVWLFVELFVIK